jgi:hypothetical protein
MGFCWSKIRLLRTLRAFYILMTEREEGALPPIHELKLKQN